MSPDKYIKNFVGGAFIEADSGKYIDNYNPAIGKVYSYLSNSGKTDVSRAVEAAEKAFPDWSTCGVQKRYQILNRLAEIINENLEAFALAESIDSGKPLSVARTIDIPRAVSNFQFFATAILHFSSESHHMEGQAINYTLRQPIGVVGCISPWNLPLYLFSWKIAPALAAGNCVVAKPSEVTPMTAYLLGKACQEAGMPDGVLNIIHGYGPEAGQAIVEHPRIKAISFTGGTRTGQHLARTAAPMFKKLSLELGGKNPNIIFADCAFEEMLSTTLRSSFANSGQICLCGSRIYVERPLYEKFRTEFVKRVEALKVGDPMAADTDMGALVSKDHFEKVRARIALAKEEGGTILCGGNAVQLEGEQAEGYYLRPTVIEGLPNICRTNQEEIFGPVVTIMPFDTPAEVLGFANSTEYGLSATVWTKDIQKINYLSQHLKAGIVWVNCWLLRDLRTPFGGVKSSGVGREGGLEALRFFTEPKNVCIKY